MSNKRGFQIRGQADFASASRWHVVQDPTRGPSGRGLVFVGPSAAAFANVDFVRCTCTETAMIELELKVRFVYCTCTARVLTTLTSCDLRSIGSHGKRLPTFKKKMQLAPARRPAPGVDTRKVERSGSAAPLSVPDWRGSQHPQPPYVHSRVWPASCLLTLDLQSQS